MKKIILLLCFFTSFPFYSQIDNLKSNQNISQIAAPLSFIATTSVINYTGCDYFGTITINATGGEAPYTYSQDGINYVSNNVFSDLAPDLYIIYTKDNTGSIATQEVILYGLKDMTDPILSVTNVSCNGGNNGSIIFDSTKYSGLYIYDINGGSPQYGNIVSGLLAGTYIIGVRNTAAGCGMMIPITITEPSALNITTERTDIACPKKGSIIITAKGGQSPYTYSKDGINYDSNNIISNLNSGTYTIYTKDSNECVSIQQVTLYEMMITKPFSLSVKNISQNGGNDGIITLNFMDNTGLFAYYLNDSMPIIGNTFSGLSAGTYFITAKNSNTDCYSYSEYITLTEPPSAFKTTILTTNVNCFGENNGSIRVNATGGAVPYLYSKDGINYDENNTFSNLLAGTYTTYAKDASNVVVSNISTISQPGALSFTALTINPTCVKKGSIIISATGGQEPYMYSKDGINYSDNNNFSDLEGDTYTIYTKDNNECISMQEIVLYSPLYFGFSTLIQDVSCNGNNDGSIIIDSVEMAFGPYTYSLDAGTPQSSNTFSNLSAGSYIVATRDTSTGCAVGYYITITEPPITLSISTAISNVSCSGNNDGTISVDVTGGKAPYFYSIDGADYLASNNFNMLFAGTYSIKVKDSDGACSVMNNIIITEPKLLTATIVVENQTITINTTGGNGEYQYSFDQNTYQLGNIFNNASYGNHLVFVRDQNGCTMDISISVYPAEPLINGENQVTVEFKPGQTLGDLVVEGQNIKWYNSANNVAKKTNKSNEATLPLSTLLVDGTTYYASQTINGIESTKRLAVTAKLNSSLATPDFTLPNFSYYPNPVQHTLSINNPLNINEVELISVIGKSVLTKKINNTHSEIDLSNVASGFYFLKVKAEGQTKTIKIVKK